MIKKIRESLVIKVFMTISMTLVLVFAVVFIVQSMFFSRYYENTKINNLIREFNMFCTELEQAQPDEDTLYTHIKKFAAENNVDIHIYNESISVGDKDKNRVLLTVLDENNEYWDFSIDYEILDSISNDSITLKGYMAGDKKLIVTYLNGTKISDYYNKHDEFKQYESTARIIEKSDFADMYKEKFYYKDMESELYSDNQYGIEYTLSEKPYTKTKIVSFRQTVDILEGSVVYASASLQPVDEAVGMISRYIPVFLSFAIIISMCIAFVYSRTVSRPIVNITKTANEMANMDFSTKEDIVRVDELGTLAKSINKMSVNLETALSNLKTANEKLKVEYENKVREDKARREFIANASHELKTPLGVVKSYVEAIRDNVKNEKRDYYFDVVMDETEKMDELIMQMLSLARLDHKDTSLNRQITDMGDLVTRVSERFVPLMNEKGIALKIEGEFGSATIDSRHIEQALSNIIDNAVKYSKQDTNIRIKGICEEETARIEVYNDCDPIDKDQIQRIWERFYKADTSHNRETVGYGLGLSIVKQILDMHGFEYGADLTDTGIMIWFKYSNDKLNV